MGDEEDGYFFAVKLDEAIKLGRLGLNNEGTDGFLKTSGELFDEADSCCVDSNLGLHVDGSGVCC